jgi:hypothetical protein
LNDKLSLKYNNITVIIEQTKEFATLSVHDLMGFLEMHEQRLSRHNDHSLESVFQLKVNVKESENHSMIKGNTSRGGFNDGKGRGNFGRGGSRSDNQEGEMNTYNFCKKLGHIENWLNVIIVKSMIICRSFID